MKFVNLNQINCCSTLKGRYPLSHMLAYHLRKILAQQFFRMLSSDCREVLILLCKT